ncbi:MAG: bis-aminopropyl spermidine synthase family protein [Vulcanimicrobiota bacterium]
MNTWLSPFIDARFGNTSEEVLFTNLAYGTRILCQRDSWQKLRGVSEGEYLPDDPWLKRAEAAFLIMSEATEVPWPDFILRLEAEMRKYLKKLTGVDHPRATEKAALSKLLDLTEESFREHSMPQPYSGPRQNVGPLMNKPSRLVDFMFCHTRAFIEHDLEDGSKDLTFGLVEKFFDRPALKLRYEQQFCIPRTTQKRAELMIERLKPGSRVLVLGDDDLVSLALVEFTDQLQVDVLELDPDLVSFLKEKGGERLTVLEHNLRHGVPDSMKNCYDAVTTDPPYADDGMRFFLECAKASLKDRAESRLFLTTYPGLLESPDKFWSDLEELELEILETNHHFSRYIYNNSYRVQHLAALRYLGSPIHPTTELLGFPFLYAHFFECRR